MQKDFDIDLGVQNCHGNEQPLNKILGKTYLTDGKIKI